MIDDFMNRLARMENEVSMMRSGYNDGVERYRSAKQRFPEVILSKLLDLKTITYLVFHLRFEKFQMLILRRVIRMKLRKILIYQIQVM